MRELARPNRGPDQQHGRIKGNLDEAFNAGARGDTRSVGCGQSANVKSNPANNPSVRSVHAGVPFRKSFPKQWARVSARSSSRVFVPVGGFLAGSRFTYHNP